MPLIKRINAIGLTVSDVDRAQDFYRQALSFEPVSDLIVDGSGYSDLEGVTEVKIRIVTLQLGDERIKLRQYLNILGKPIPDDSQSNDLWFQHLAIAVSDMDRAHTHLKTFPIEPISVEPQTIPPENQASAGVRAFKFKDLDRHNLEIIWFPPDKGQDKWQQNTDRLFLGIDHSAIAISNTEPSLQFYRDLLGMQIDGGSLNQGETQARLDNLPNAKVKITALRPDQGGMGIELLDYLVPGSGRPMPSDWRSCDIAHMQVELVVPDLEQAVTQLRQNNIQFAVAASSCLVKDPDGHAMLLSSDPGLL